MININIVIKNDDISTLEKEWINNNCKFIGVDTETTGLNPVEDKLCLIQISAGSKCFVIHYNNTIKYNNLIDLMIDNNLCKIFHHAVFDVRFLLKNLDIETISNIKCTKISAKLLFGIKAKNSLKDLLSKYLDVDVNKEQQLSDWSQAVLKPEQVNYAANDVVYLIDLWNSMEKDLIYNDYMSYAQKCFDFVTVQAILANKGINNIFEY